MADDWESINVEEPIRLPSRHDDRWEGEDAEEDVKDNWDDEDPVESQEDTSKSESAAGAKPKSKTPRQLREEKKKLEELERARIQAEKDKLKTPQQLMEEKLERQRLQEESDLELAREALGAGRTTSPLAFSDVALNSREDFDAFTKNLVAKMQNEQKSPYYVPFLENLFRDLCVSLEVDDIKRLSASLNALFNEKVKAQKGDKKPKKKGVKVAIKMDKSDFDMEADGGGNYDDDYDDFM